MASGDPISESRRTSTERDTGRIEAFSDGVFAIAITLLILEVKIPHPPGAASIHLLAALLGLWPSYLALVLSFIMIGIYWANHHYIFKLFDKTNHGLNLLNLLFLLCISFLPFPTAVLGDYLLDAANQTTAASFYAIGLLLPAAGWLLMWLYASRGQRLISRRLDPGFLRRLTIQYIGSVALYALAVLVSLVEFRAGLAICIGLTLLYLRPPNIPAYVHPGRRG
jgi:uncharacterized membrane protein